MAKQIKNNSWYCIGLVGLLFHCSLTFAQPPKRFKPKIGTICNQWLQNLTIKSWAPRVEDIEWKGERRPEAGQWKKFVRLAPEKAYVYKTFGPAQVHHFNLSMQYAKEGKRFTQAHMTRTYRLINGEPYVTNLWEPGILQKIVENGDYENGLIANSNLDTWPHEVGQFRILTSKGVETLQLKRGNSGEVVFNTADIVRDVNRRLKKIKKDGAIPLKIEFNHVHPDVEIANEVYRDNYIHDLSAGDLAVTRKLSRIFNEFPLIMRATTVGQTYLIEMKNGILIQPE